MKFIKEPTLSDNNRIEFDSKSITLPEVLEDFKCFLMACGYAINPSDELIIFQEEE
jgi:hypothetical protein